MYLPPPSIPLYQGIGTHTSFGEKKHPVGWVELCAYLFRHIVKPITMRIK